MSQQESAFERGVAIGAGVAVGVVCVGLAGRVAEWMRQNLRMPTPEELLRLRLDLSRYSDTELFDSLVNEEVERLGGLTHEVMFPRAGGVASPAADFYFSLSLTLEESLRIGVKRFQKSQEQRAARRSVLAGIIQPHREEILRLNPQPRQSATQSILVAAAQRAKEAVPVERPVAQIAAQQVKEKRGKGRAGKPLARTHARLSAFLKWWREGCSTQEAVAKAALETKGRYRKQSHEELSIKRAIKKHLERIPKSNWGSLKFG
jgi:hypothetical protein